jgi:AraC-like DNA-binding protein
MDLAAKKMDFPNRHWQPCERHRLAPFRLVLSNFLKDKNYWIRRTFDSCNFSIIFRGSGEYWRSGKRWPIQAPCVITQWPGEPLQYGPHDAPSNTWDELYLIYGQDTHARFVAARLIDPTLPVWPIHDFHAVLDAAEALARVSRAQDWEQMADRADRLAELLILETWQGALRFRECAPEQDIVQSILCEMRGRLDDPRLNPEVLASRRGWSVAQLRRHWSAAMPESPTRTLQSLRMQKACRLLAESATPIHEIASRTGFADEFYFSRRFSQTQGMSPRAYRQLYFQAALTGRASTPPFARSA